MIMRAIRFQSRLMLKGTTGWMFITSCHPAFAGPMPNWMFC